MVEQALEVPVSLRHRGVRTELAPSRDEVELKRRPAENMGTMGSNEDVEQVKCGLADLRLRFAELAPRAVAHLVVLLLPGHSKDDSDGDFGPPRQSGLQVRCDTLRVGHRGDLYLDRLPEVLVALYDLFPDSTDSGETRYKERLVFQLSFEVEEAQYHDQKLRRELGDGGTVWNDVNNAVDQGLCPDPCIPVDSLDGRKHGWTSLQRERVNSAHLAHQKTEDARY